MDVHVFLLYDGDEVDLGRVDDIIAPDVATRISVANAIADVVDSLVYGAEPGDSVEPTKVVTVVLR